MNHFMDFDPHLVRERNERMRQEVRSVRIEKVLRNSHRERKEERAGMKGTLGDFLGRIATLGRSRRWGGC
jgi:lipoprotein NlpI